MQLFIAIPSYSGKVHSKTMLSIINLIRICTSTTGDEPYVSIHSYNGDIADARNRLCNTFLESDATHLLFVDDDMTFNANAVYKMLEAYSADIQATSVIAALCPRKDMDTGEGVFDCYSPEQPYMHGTKALVNVDRVGAGIMLIPRGALETVEPFIDTTPHEGIGIYFRTQLFPEHISEDYYFCDILAEAQVDLYIAMWTKDSVGHMGLYEYRGI